jgi:hypothetical protein
VTVFKVTMILADAVQAVCGKLYILGGGWSQQWGLAPFGIGIKIDVPWDKATDAHTLRLELVDADGEAIEVPTPEGAKPLVIEGGFNTGITPGIKRGVPMDAVVAFNFGPIPLDPGRYVWRFSIDGETHEDWQLAFTRLAAAPPQAQTG